MSAYPSHWIQTEIGKVSEVVTGKTPPTTSPHYYNGEIPFVKPPDLEADPPLLATRDSVTAAGAETGRLLPEGTVAVSCIGNLGKVAMLGKPAITNQQINAIIPTEGLESKFVYFWAKTLKPWLEQNASATTVAIINKGRFSTAPIGVPPLPEQRRIVAKIEDLTARSRAAKQALDAIPPLLERFRQSVLAAAFRGDLTKQWREQNPNVEPASVLLDRIRQERRQRWEQDYLAQQKAKGKTPKDDKWKAKYQEPEPVDTTGLPELPAGWCWVKLGTLALDGPTNGYSPLTGPDASGPLTLKLSATTSGELYLSKKTTKRVHEDIPENSRFWLEDGDILIQRANTLDYVGTAAVFSGPRMTYIYPDLMMRIRVLDGSLGSFVTNSINSPFCRSFLTSRATGTAGNMPKINGKTVRDLPIPVPPEQEITSIVRVTEQALQSMRQLSDFCNSLTVSIGHLNQSILAKAFRGELVPQDPNDEPASVLLERIRAEREAKTAGDSGKKRKARK